LNKMPDKKRVLVFGIDGATFDLVKPWMADGSLPNLAKVFKQGASGELESTLPPNSAPAWTSFMTGMNPGKHGLYGFTRVEPREGYGIKINSGAVRRAQTVWQYLTTHGRRSIVLNVPMTYPPEPIDGVVVTGIDTPGLESQFTYPPEFRNEVFRLAPEFILDIRSWGVEAAGDRRAKLFDDIMRMVESRRKLALNLMTSEPWDLFTVVFTATDRAMHFFWRFLDPAHPLYDPDDAPRFQDAILRVYQSVDGVLGEMLAKCGEDTTLIVMSDHGFGPQRRLFRINEWLLENGFLEMTHAASNGRTARFSGGAQKWMYRSLDSVVGLARTALSDTAKDRLKRMFPRLRERVASQILFTGVDWSETRAYHTAEFPGSIRVNMKGREVKGIVEPGAEYDAVCESVRSALEAYVDPDTGKRVVERVYQRDEFYWGPNVELAPDLIVHLADYAYTIDWYMPVHRDGTDGDLPVIDKLTGEYAVNCGSHRLDGIVMLYGDDIRKGVHLDPAKIHDVIPTALYLLGLPIPTDMDGQVLTTAIKADLLERQPIELGDSVSSMGDMASDQTFSEEEAEAVANRLRDLGYL
jgi:predicted AlkP superfamily phosphohydrolase/phosphomutase